jgi:hypothetical protein
MRKRKAARGAASGKARDPQRVDQSSPAKIDADAILQNPALQSVYAGRTCISFLLSRGKLGIEAFSVNERSLSIFPTLKAAADAISAAMGGAP